MTLNHSKTWPINTFAVVQLRVDSEGHIYSALSNQNVAVGDTRLESGTHLDNGTAPDSHSMHSERENPRQFHEEFTPTRCNANSLNESMKNHVSDTQENKMGHPDDVVKSSRKEYGAVLPLSRKHLEMFAKISPPPPQFRTTVRTDTVSTILDQEMEFDYEPSQEGEKYNIRQVDISQVENFHVLALARIEETSSEGECRIGRRPSIRVDNWDYIYTEKSNNGDVNPGHVRCPIHRYGSEGHHSNLRRDSSEPDLPLDARKSATLRRHYYPEGGWGWVVVVCSVLVHVLNHGVQLSSSQLILPGVEKFKVEPVHFA
ncbi:hypothetical protein HHI36_012452, partial [Cryptolaemus montrouzieri]